MKIMIASDIHGSAGCCRQLLERFREERADRLLLLGDLLYHGPRNDLPEDYAPKQVIALLNEYRDVLYCVRGNCEAEVDQMVLAFPVMADYALLPVGSRMVFVTHGHVFNQGNLPPMKKGDILLYGHTHVPACEENDGFVFMNPGSVSLPKNGTSRGYMTLDGNVFEWKTLDGEIFSRYEA
jgi:hypothetical protein